MIYDKVENMSLYFSKLHGFEQVEKAYKDFCLKPFAEGRIDIDGDNLWCNVASYTVNPDNPLKYEAHKAYADVQVMFRVPKASAGLTSTNVTSQRISRMAVISLLWMPKRDSFLS